MAQCGKCGKPLDEIYGLAFDPGHVCQGLLTGAKQVTIVVLATGECIVGEGELFADHLTWGEMIEQVISLTHPSIKSRRYAMRTARECGESDRKWGDNSTEVDVANVPIPVAEVVEVVPVAGPPVSDEDIPF